MFISPTSGIGVHDGVRQRWLDYQGSFRSWSKECAIGSLSQMEHRWVSFTVEAGAVYFTKKTHKACTNNLGKLSNKRVLLLMVLDNNEV